LPDRLLDTNAISAAMKADERFMRHLEQVAQAGRIMTSVVVEGEVTYGILGLPAGRRRAALQSALTEIMGDLDAILPITRRIDTRYARLKCAMRARGTPMGENDLWIAATAVAHRLILVSNDEAFRSVPGLKTEAFCPGAA
jgi:tRNA(fMet)-specific endonuclease VapC